MTLMVAAKAMLQTNEGVRLDAYLDDTGHWTTAFGFNLERSGAAVAVEAVGADYEAIWDAVHAAKERGKKQTAADVVTLDQAQALFDNDVMATIAELRRIFADFDAMPAPAQLVLVDLCYNLGGGELRSWTHTVRAFREHDYAKAAVMLEKNKLWRSQVKSRATRDIDMLRSIK